MERNPARTTKAIGKGERTDSQRSKGASGFVIVGELQDLGACVVFPFHDYKIAQDGEKARDFFAIV